MTPAVLFALAAHHLGAAWDRLRALLGGHVPGRAVAHVIDTGESTVTACGENPDDVVRRGDVIVMRVDFDRARINREVARVRALAEASPEVRSMIEAARSDHDRVVGRLAAGRVVLETGERWEVWQGSRRCSFVPEKTAPEGVEQVATRMWASERNKMLDNVGSKGPRYRALRVRVARLRRAR